MVGSASQRDTLFISKATPGDDAFVLWLAPRLEAAGYKVFADILDLQGGDRWRTKITNVLRNEAARMLLCCSDRTLARPGAAPAGTTVVGIRIKSTHGETKLFREGDYPVLRGTALLLDPQNAYLWAAGYAPRIDIEH